jgi:hypothetical protein
MYLQDSEDHEVVKRDRVYVTWTEYLTLEEYVLGYLRSRRLAIDRDAQATVLRQIAKHPGHAAYRKLEMDFYLDSTLLTRSRQKAR